MMKKILIATLPLISTSALAHTGHLADDSIHGFLHVEHIAVLTAIGLVAYFIAVSRGK